MRVIAPLSYSAYIVVAILTWVLPAVADTGNHWRSKVDEFVLMEMDDGLGEFLVFLSEQADLNHAAELPDKLAALGKRIDYRLLSGQTAEQVQAVATSLQAVAYRIKDLVDARNSQLNDLLVAAVIDDVRAWRMLAQKQFQLWADDPAQSVDPGVSIQDRLMARIAKLEAQIGKSLRGIEEGQLSEKDYENFYRLMGFFRGLSESGTVFERSAQSIDWGLWKEARF